MPTKVIRYFFAGYPLSRFCKKKYLRAKSTFQNLSKNWHLNDQSEHEKGLNRKTNDHSIIMLTDFVLITGSLGV